MVDYTIGIIPARGNSKGIPGKNLKMLGDIPLLGWTLQAAMLAGLNELWVTSESPEILSFAQQYGAQVYRRAYKLSQDFVQSDEVYLDLLRHIQFERTVPREAMLVMLAPTSPFRDARDIKNALDLFNEKNGLGTVVAVCEDRKFHWDMKGNPVCQDPQFRLGRQDTKDWLYREAGSIYIQSLDSFSKWKVSRVAPYHMFVLPEWKCIDLDEPADWQIAESYLPLVQ